MSKDRQPKQKLNASLGQIIRQARLDAGLTQNAVAEKVEIESKYLSVIENGHGFPSFEKLTQLVRTLRIDPRLIFEETPEVQPRAERDKILDLLSSLSDQQLKKMRPVIASLVEALK